MPLGLISAALFAFGAIAASLLLCFAWRQSKANKNKSLGQRSVCDHCGKQLSAVALIPVLGFFIVRGKCQKCGHDAPYYSLLAEVLIGSIWAGVFYHQPQLNWWSLLGFFVVSACLVTIVMNDFFWQEIPVPLIWATGLVLVGLLSLQTSWLPNFSASGTGALVAAGFFLWQYVLSRGRWVSSEDMWVGALSGALIGWNAIVLGTAVAYVGAALYSILCALVKRQEKLDRVPLSAFLAWSTLIFLLAKLV